jgi:hypothetical protein
MPHNDEAETETSTTKEQRWIIRTLPPSLIKGKIPPRAQAEEWILSYTAVGKVCLVQTVSIEL